MAEARTNATRKAPLRDGGHVIVTNPDQADTDPFNLANLDKQRQLNDAGRAKAKEIGEAFRGQVHTSPLYRAIETGKLTLPDIPPRTTIDFVETRPISSFRFIAIPFRAKKNAFRQFGRPDCVFPSGGGKK